jgi:hypothetical protein
MAEKKIEIKIAATGGQQAASEIGGVSDSAKRLGEETKKAVEGVSQLDENVQTIARAQKAQLIGNIAAKTFEIGAAMKATGAEIREFDAEMGAALENAGAAMERTAEAASAMAQGFAVGGPLGAAVGGATVGLTLFKEATIETTRAIAGWDQASERAAEMGRKLAEAQRYGIENVLAAADATERLNEITKTATESIKDQIDSLESRNRVLAAEDRAKSATRDRQDADRIASGADRVRAERAKYDAEIQISQINRAEEAKAAPVQEAFEAYRTAQTQAERVRNDPNATEDQSKNADQKVEELKKQFERLQADYEEIRQINRARRVEINERATGRIEIAEGQRAERMQRQKADEERERIKAEIEARESALDRSAAGASGMFMTAGGRVSGALSKTLSDIGDKMADGTNQKEIEGLAAKFHAATQGMGGATIAAMREMIAAQEAQAREIAILRSKIRNS